MEPTQAQRDEVFAAAEAVHNATCDPKHDWKGCILGRKLASMATLEALRHLETKPRDVAAVRLMFHDAVCMSGCTGASAADHAKRTQSKVATALRKFVTQRAAA